MLPTAQKVGSLMKTVISRKLVTWYNGRISTPPYNKLVLICYQYGDTNIYLGYFDNNNKWHLIDGIYNCGVELDAIDSFCNPCAWAYLPKNAFTGV